MSPFWLVAYVKFGSAGSLRVVKPSPPPERYQSLVRTPTVFCERCGPHIDPLSCDPPQTL